jgi:hypothetical protein
VRAPGFNPKTAAGRPTIASRFVDVVALLTTVSKLHIACGVVRVSARMVGILLNSCSQRESYNDLHLSLRSVLSERRRREFE